MRILLVLFLFQFCKLQAQPPCNLKLDSIYLDNTYSNCSHLYFKFDYSGGTPAHYMWTYGDGNSCSCVKPKNFYNANGNYQVCGRIEDANGCADSLCITVNVNCSDPCDLSAIGIYSADTLSLSCREVEFNSIVSSNTKHVLWTFGDGKSSSDLYVIHTYKINGNYQARLIVKDSLQCSDTAEFSIHVDCADSVLCDFYILQFDTLRYADCMRVRFMAGFTHTPFTYELGFGDGNTSNNQTDLIHTYADTGYYHAYLKASDSFNCADTVYMEVPVYCQTSELRPKVKPEPFIIYPNPSDGDLFIRMETDGAYELYSIQGKLLNKGVLKQGDNLLNLNSATENLYILRLKSADRVYYIRININ